MPGDRDQFIVVAKKNLILLRKDNNLVYGNDDHFPSLSLSVQILIIVQTADNTDTSLVVVDGDSVPSKVLLDVSMI